MKLRQLFSRILKLRTRISDYASFYWIRFTTILSVRIIENAVGSIDKFGRVNK